MSQRLRESFSFFFFFFFFFSRESIVHSPPCSRFFASFLFLAVSPRLARRIILCQVFSCLRLVPRDCIPAIEFKGILALPGRRVTNYRSFTAGKNFHQHFRQPIERNVFRSYPTFIRRSTIRSNNPLFFRSSVGRTCPSFHFETGSKSLRFVSNLRIYPPIFQ